MVCAKHILGYMDVDVDGLAIYLPDQPKLYIIDWTGQHVSEKERHPIH